jgi:hypothetical protein
MNKENSHIKTYLDYYCSLETAPGQAIMLSGQPGVGKTWVISQYRKSLTQKGIKSLYISLFGINSFTEIENSFLEQLHPILSQKGMGLSSKILRDPLKATVNLEIDKEILQDSASANWNIPTYLVNSKDYVLIMDDIDRCYLSTAQIFGYINFLLEHHGFKIVIIANEDALSEREDNAHIEELGYRKIKDKIIGRTFKVKPDFEEAFEVAIKSLKSQNTLNCLKDQQKAIKEIFTIAKSANLRHLQHSIIDFERLFLSLPIDCHSKQEFLAQLVKVFMIFSLEIRSSNIHSPDLKGLKLKFHSRLFSKFTYDEHKSPQTYLIEKYKKFQIHNTIFKESWWIDFFEKGKIIQTEVSQELKSCHCFFSEETPSSLKLSCIWQLSDEQFQELLREIQIEFNSQKFLYPGEIKLVVSFLLWASDNQLLPKEKSQIISDAKNYVENLVKIQKLKIENLPSISEMLRQSWNDIPYFTVSMSEFKNFCNFLDEMHEKRYLQKAAMEADNILQIMKSDPERFSSIITFPTKEDRIYHDLPVLSYISPDNFFKALLSLKPEKRLLIGQSLQERYYMGKSNRKIIPEAGWLRSLIDLIYSKSEELTGSLSSFALKAIADKYLVPSMERIESLMIERQE